jgi:hypothetical protein
MSKTIRIACDTKDHLSIDDLTPLQGGLKTLSKQNYAKLKKEILTTGFAFPMYVWKNKKIRYIIGGHQRLECLKTMRDEGFTIPNIPVVFIEASSIQEAKRRVLQDVGQYGRVDRQGLYDFMQGAEISIDDLSTSFSVPDTEFNMDGFRNEFFNDAAIPKDNIYTDKIKSPIYQPTGEKPKPKEIYDLTKTNQLLSEINSVVNLPEDIRMFLIFSAYRHIVFNYEKIAEFYCHQNIDVQGLMEKSALVIIDFKKAIEEGFIKLTDEISESFDQNNSEVEDE